MRLEGMRLEVMPVAADMRVAGTRVGVGTPVGAAITEQAGSRSRSAGGLRCGFKSKARSISYEFLSCEFPMGLSAHPRG